MENGIVYQRQVALQLEKRSVVFSFYACYTLPRIRIQSINEVSEMTIGERIKVLRKRNDLTQEKLADYLCVSYQAVSKWECGVSHN